MATETPSETTARPRRPSTLVEALEHNALELGENDAYTFLLDGEESAESLSWAGVDERSRALAALVARDAAPGERVLLLCPPGLDFIVAFLACLRAGVVAVPAYPPASRRHLPRLRSIVVDAEPKVAITVAALLPKIQAAAKALSELAGTRWLTTDEAAGDAAAELARGFEPPAVRPEDLAFLQYTSGSTAEPKGVEVTHGNLVHNEELIRRGFGLHRGSVIVGWLPLYHDMGLIGNVLQPLYLGARCVLMSPVAFLQKPLRWLEAISRHRGTCAGGPNFAYELCVRKTTAQERAALDLSSWTLAYNGSEPVRAGTLDRFAEAFAPAGFHREAFYPCYGLAEATLMVSGGDERALPVVAAVDAGELEQHRVVASEEGRRLVGCGHTYLDQEIRIVDPESRRLCGDAEVGEIWLTGGSVAGGYWRRPEATERDFRARLEGADDERPYLRTGDLGFLRDGELFVTGRLKDLVIIRGRNHYPQDLELTAERSHPSLRPGCSAAFAVDAAGEERLVIVQEVDRHLSDEPEVIAEAVRREVAEGHEVQVYDVVLIRTGTIPKTSSGKIQRRACRAAYLADQLPVVGRSRLDAGEAAEVVGGEVALDRATLLSQPVEAQRGLLEAYLRDQVAGLLKVPAASIEADQPLSALGLDSLAAIELQGRVDGAFGVEIEWVGLLEGTSLAEVAGEVLGGLAGAAERAAAIAGDQGEHPLSYGQRALWYLHRHSPDAAAYNLAGAARVRGELDVEALGRALGTLSARHPALRTVFGAPPGGEPRALVRPELAPEVATEDASEWSPERLEAHLVAEAHRPFDLARGPLLRLAVLKAAPRLYRVVMVAHHTIADFWSLGVMLRELDLLYRTETGGEAAVLEPLPLTPADFARRERALIESSEGERLLAYWREQLAGELPILDLPTDFPRPKVQTFRGLSRALRLEGELLERLRGLSTARGTTLYMTLLAAFQTLLRRIGGQEEVMVGSPTALRGWAGTAGMVSYLVNPVALRGDLRGDPSFEQLLARVREVVIGAFAPQRAYPFPLLVEKLRPAHDPSRSPIFQAMLVWQRDRPGSEQQLAGFALGQGGVHLRLGDLDVESAPLAQESAQFDLTLSMAEVRGELWASLQVNSDLFEALTAERWLGHLATLLGDLARSPEKRLSRLEMLTESERRQLLEEWNEPSGRGEEATLWGLFAARAAEAPEAEALIDGERRLSYCQLERAAARLARDLCRRGVGPEVPVGLCSERRAEMVVGMLGVLGAGGAYVPLDPDYPAQRLVFTLEDSRVPVLLVCGEPPAGLPEVDAEVIDLEAYAPDTEPPEDTGPPEDTERSGEPLGCPARPDNLAYVIYTSGSTGRPKGVAIAHRSAATMVRWAMEVFPPEATAGLLASTSICFDLSVFEIFLPLASGTRLVLARNALELPSLPAAGEVTLVNTVPSAIAELAGRLPPSVATVCLAGEPLPRELVERIYAQETVAAVYNLYGPSEDTTYSTFARIEKGGGDAPAIGRPIGRSQVYLSNRYLQLVPQGKPGELLLAGAGLCRGYLGRPARTAERFVPDPFGAVAGGRLYRTGDLARHRRDGVLDFLGRLDHQVKVRGFRIELGEIEAALDQHPAVAEAVALALGQGADRDLVAYVVCAAGHEAPTPQKLRDHLAVRLPFFMVPNAFVFLDALPLTPNGKLDRGALPDPDPSAAVAASNYVEPATEVELALAEIWREVLEVERVGIYDSFFDLGGHSLKATRVLSAVYELFGVDLPVRALLEAPTINGLAEAIARKLMEEADEETLAEVMAELG